MIPPTTFEPGQRIGNLVVVAPAGSDPRGRLWALRCDCGEAVTRSASALGTSLSRGAARCRSCWEVACCASFEPGHRIGSLTVVEFAGRDPRGRLWRLRCDCGEMTVRPAAALGVSVSRGVACCRSCWESRRRAGHAAFLDRRRRRWHWDEYGTLYADHEVEDMCVQVDDALVAEFGSRRDREPRVDELQWGRSQVCT